MDTSKRHSQSDFAHNLLFKASLWCVLLRKRQIYNSKSDWWIQLLLIFLYFNSKFKVTCKNENFDLDCRCIKAHIEANSLKFALCQLPFCFFSYPNRPLNAFQIVHSSPNGAKFRVCQSQACFLYTNHLGILKHAYLKCACCEDSEIEK